MIALTTYRIVLTSQVGPDALSRGHVALNFPFLELREDVLQDMLELPEYFCIEKASCSAVHAKVSWTKLKSTPVQLVYI